MKISGIFNGIGKIFGTGAIGKVAQGKAIPEEKIVTAPGDSVSLSSKISENEKPNSAADLKESKQAEQKTEKPKGSFEKPDPGNFATFGEYDESLIKWQTDNIKRLGGKHPAGYIRGITVFYGTHLPPEEILKNGIPEKGGASFDIRLHQQQMNDKGSPDEKFSAMRGCCVSAQVPAGMVGEDCYVYKLVPLGGGVSVDAALQGKRGFDPMTMQLGNLMPGETEIVMGSRQPAYQIEGYYKVGEYSKTFEMFRLGEFVKNPNFNPRNE